MRPLAFEGFLDFQTASFIRSSQLAPQIIQHSSLVSLTINDWPASIRAAADSLRGYVCVAEGRDYGTESISIRKTRNPGITNPP